MSKLHQGHSFAKIELLANKKVIWIGTDIDILEKLGHNQGDSSDQDKCWVDI